MLDGIIDPAFAEALPRDAIDGALAEHGPHRHLIGAGIGGGHDADAVPGGDLQYVAGEIDSALQAGFAGLCAVRTAQRGVFKGVRCPAGALGAGAARELRINRPQAGDFLCHFISILTDGRPSLGRGVPLREIRGRDRGVNGKCRIGDKKIRVGVDLAGRLP